MHVGLAGGGAEEGVPAAIEIGRSCLKAEEGVVGACHAGITGATPITGVAIARCFTAWASRVVADCDRKAADCLRREGAEVAGRGDPPRLKTPARRGAATNEGLRDYLAFGYSKAAGGQGEDESQGAGAPHAFEGHQYSPFLRSEG